MPTAEQMAKSISLEKQGVFALLWDAKEDLVRALLILNAALHDIPKRALLLAPGSQSVSALRTLIETRVIIADPDEVAVGAPAAAPARELWLVFVQQASSQAVGPLLNGWRSSLRQAYGTIIIARHIDFERFQRAAPDLSSFIGPRIYNASNLLSLFSDDIKKHLSLTLPTEWVKILVELPGAMPPDDTIREWIVGSSSESNG
jgi:hypothetical protein